MGRFQEHRAQAARERLTGIVGEMLAELRGGPAPRVSLDDDLERELGVDSLARVELVLRVERAFGVRLPETLVAEARTPRELLRALAVASPRVVPDLPRTHGIAAPSEGIEEPRAAATLIEALDWHAIPQAQRVHIRLLEGDEQAERLTYGALAAEARRAAAGLAAGGISPGEMVAIMLPTGRAFFLAFIGALLAGAVPVPLVARRSSLRSPMRSRSRASCRRMCRPCGMSRTSPICSRKVAKSGRLSTTRARPRSFSTRRAARVSPACETQRDA